MTIAEITKVQDKSNLKYETAKKIRALLDETKKAYGAADYVDDDIEATIIELVTE